MPLYDTPRPTPIFPGHPQSCADNDGVGCVRGAFVHSDVEATGMLEFPGDQTETAAVLDDIHRAVLQSQLSNLVSLPTDCPHREKRVRRHVSCVCLSLKPWIHVGCPPHGAARRARCTRLATKEIPQRFESELCYRVTEGISYSRGLYILSKTTLVSSARSPCRWLVLATSDGTVDSNRSGRTPFLQGWMGGVNLTLHTNMTHPSPI